MQFPKYLHADGWHARMPVRPPDPPMPLADHDAAAHHDSSHHARRRFHILLVVVAIGALLASAGLDVVRDDRPLDVQLSAAMHKVGDTLKSWQEQLSRGLQVSLRAVADGSEEKPAAKPEPAPSSGASTVVAQAVPAVASTADQEQPVRADLAPRQPQPIR